MTLRTPLLASAAGLVFVVFNAESHAQQGTLNVSAFVGDACTFTSAALDFAEHVPGGLTEGAGVIDINCTRATTIDVELGAGAQSAGNGTRTMFNDANDPMLYTLYKDSARSDSWAVDEAVPFAVTVGSNSLPVYGRIDGSTQNTPDGAYADAVAVTITFN